jgi:hypothetical protein
MGFIDVIDHLINFVLPAWAMALILPTLARLLFWRAWAGVAWWAVAKRVAWVGMLVLLVGLLVLGRDGAMLTYAALVLASSTVVWLMVFNAKSPAGK